MPQAFVMISHDGLTIRQLVDLDLPPEFTGVKYARFRMLETRRLVQEGINAALEKFDADRPLTNETLFMISFIGLPKPEPKKD